MSQENVTNGSVYKLEFLDVYGKCGTMEFGLDEYEYAYSQAQHTSADNNIDYAGLSGGDLEEPLMFEDGNLVKS